MDPIMRLSEAMPAADGLREAAEATKRNYKKVAEQLENEDLG